MPNNSIINNTIYVVLDETSAMHLINEQYYIIGGYVTNNITLIKSRCNKVEKALKFNNSYINNLKEIKGNKLKAEHLIKYVSYVKNTENFIPISILVNKHQLNKKKWNENEAFNFFVKWLINYLIKCKIINVSVYKNIEIHMDNRTISTKFKDSLETHLNLNFHNYNVNFLVFSKDSKIYSEIRCADIICYILYRIYNHSKNEKTQTILELLIKFKINLIEYQSLFPYKNHNNFIKNLDFFLENDKLIT